jgi:hypothetical protein
MMSTSQDEVVTHMANVDGSRDISACIDKGEIETRNTTSEKRQPMSDDNAADDDDEGKNAKQINTNNASLVTLLTSEQYNYRANIDNSMINHISSTSNDDQAMSTSRNISSHLTKMPSIVGNTHRTNKTHHLDDSDDEIIEERWGDDTKTRIHYEGDLKIEEYVEFEEIEPTDNEEIVYEMTFVNNQIQSYHVIHQQRFQSRNFRKIRKRRVKRQHTSDIHQRAHQLLNQMHDVSQEIDSIIRANEQQMTNSNDNQLTHGFESFVQGESIVVECAIEFFVDAGRVLSHVVDMIDLFVEHIRSIDFVCKQVNMSKKNNRAWFRLHQLSMLASLSMTDEHIRIDCCRQTNTSNFFLFIFYVLF